MKHNVDAIYVNGTFKPLGANPLGLAEGQRVRILVEENNGIHANENVLELAAQVYAGLADDEVADIERIATDRSSF